MAFHAFTPANRGSRRVHSSVLPSLSVFVVSALLAVGVVVGLAQPAAASLGNSQTTLTLNWNRVQYGNTITARAEVFDTSDSCRNFRDCDAPTGRVNLYDNNIHVGLSSLQAFGHDRSYAFFVLGYFPNVGAHGYQAFYSGDFNSSNSYTAPLHIEKRDCSLDLNQTRMQSTEGESVDFRAFVRGGTGLFRWVNFYDHTGRVVGRTSGNDDSNFVLWTSRLPVGTTHVHAVAESDGNHNACTSNSVTHTVVRPNAAPIANDDVVFASPGRSVVIDVLANDVDNDLLTVTLERPPGSGQVSVGDDGLITYKPNAGFFGQDGFDYRITDPGGLSDVGNVNIDVDCLVRNDDSYTVAYNTPLVVDDPGVLANDTYICGSPMVWVDDQPQHGTVVLQPSGGFTYTPADGFLGYDTFTYRFEGLYSSGFTNVDLLIGNTAPAAVDQAVTAVSGHPTPITLTAADPDAEPLRFSVGPQMPQHGTVSGTAPNLTYTAVVGYTGPDAFTFTVEDTHGHRDEGTVTIDVIRANAPPISADTSVTVVEDTSAAVTLSASDPDGDPLSFVVTSGPRHGSLAGAVPDLTYTPDSDFEGADSIEFTVDDGRGGTDTGTVTISVTPAVPGPTRMAALGGTRVVMLKGITFENLRARLTRAASGVPVAGEVVSFAVDGTVVCTAITSATGDAACSGGLFSALRLVTSGRYTAAYAGDGDELLGTSGSAALSTRIRLL